MSQWQPIETAPKDGTLVLTWGECRAQYAVSYWDEEWLTDFREKGGYQIVYATHWMPLPEPPVVCAAGGDVCPNSCAKDGACLALEDAKDFSPEPPEGN